jgi:hypothetical protein
LVNHTVGFCNRRLNPEGPFVVFVDGRSERKRVPIAVDYPLSRQATTRSAFRPGSKSGTCEMTHVFLKILVQKFGRDLVS